MAGKEAGIGEKRAAMGTRQEQWALAEEEAGTLGASGSGGQRVMAEVAGAARRRQAAVEVAGTAEKR